MKVFYLKFLKNSLIWLCTIFLILDLFFLGLANNLKGSVKDAVSAIVKQEITNEVVKALEDNFDVDVDKEQITEKMQDVLEKNETVSHMIDKYYNLAFDFLSGKENVEDIQIVDDVDQLMNDSEEVLKEYNIELDEQVKEDIRYIAASPKVTELLNEGIATMQEKIPNEFTTLINIITFVTSSTFKIILIVIILILLLSIGLLKKSYYRWFKNLGIASIISAIPLLTLHYLVHYITTTMLEDSVVISLSSISFYSYVSIILGVLEIVIYIIFHKKTVKNEK